jgi:hypothetical protein
MDNQVNAAGQWKNHTTAPPPVIKTDDGESVLVVEN